MIDQFQKSLKKIGKDREEKLEETLHNELKKLSKADQQSIKQVMNADKLNGKIALDFLKTTTGTYIAQFAIGTTGFGAYLFLSTMIKAFSLLIGATFPFVVYTTAATVFSFLLSPVFLAFIALASLTFGFFESSGKIKMLLSKILIISGRYRLMEENKKIANE